jgi:Kef-type K+ transport system membrane component KefB
MNIMLTVLSFAIDLLWIPTLILCVGFKMAFYRYYTFWSYAVIPVYPVMAWGLIDFIYRFITGFDVSLRRPRKMVLALSIITIVTTIFSMWAATVAIFAAWGDMILLNINAALLLTPGMISVVLLIIVMCSPFCYKIIQTRNAGRTRELQIAVVALLILLLTILPVMLFVALLIVRMEMGSIAYYWIFAPLCIALFGILILLCTGFGFIYKYRSI